MYATLRQSFYWLLMTSDVYALAESCRTCAKVHETRYTRQKELHLFPAKVPLADVALDLLGPLHLTKTGNSFTLVMTCRLEVARAVPLPTTTAANVATSFLDHCVYPYGIHTSILTDNGPQFFAALCVFLCTRQLKTATYHPPTNGQVERYNKTLVTRLAHYLDEHQNDWDAFVQPLTYA